MKWNKPLPMAELTVMNTENAKDYVLENAGATLPVRDAVDARIIRGIVTGKIEYDPNVKPPTNQFKHRRLPIDSYKIGMITEIAQVGGYPAYKGTPYKDSDNDGMPDDWEKAKGLDPNKNDAKERNLSTAYDNIEVYINSLVKEITEKQYGN